MRSRRSAKQAVKSLIRQIMLERPLNHPRVVVELNTLGMLCREMGWEKMNAEIKSFIAPLDAEIIDRGMTEGRLYVAKEKQG